MYCTRSPAELRAQKTKPAAMTSKGVVADQLREYRRIMYGPVVLESYGENLRDNRLKRVQRPFVFLIGVFVLFASGSCCFCLNLAVFRGCCSCRFTARSVARYRTFALLTKMCA